MATTKLKRLDTNTAEIMVDIPWGDIEKQYSTALEHMAKEIEVEGFRKGKVPSSVAEKNLQKDQIYQHAIQDMLPNIYNDIVKKEALKPVVNPKIELLQAKEGETWQLKITVAEKPTVTIADYKSIVKELKSSSKKDEIWVPGKDQAKKDSPDQEEQKRKLLDQILESVSRQSKVEIPDLIVEEELNARLARLLDDIQKIGLTTEAYLKSRNTTMEAIRERYRKEVEEVYKLEFILGDIADKENLSVEQKELDQLFEKITDSKERQEAQANAYFYASVIRKQKTLDFLLNI